MEQLKRKHNLREVEETLGGQAAEHKHTRTSRTSPGHTLSQAGTVSCAQGTKQGKKNEEGRKEGREGGPAFLSYATELSLNVKRLPQALQ